MNAHLLLAFLLGVLTALSGTALAESEPSSVVATLTHVDTTLRRTAPHGKASVTLLGQGERAFLGILEIAPGAKVPTHRDGTEEYIHILEGGGTMTLDGKRREVSRGHTIFMPARAEVSYENGEARTRAIQVFAGPGPAAKYDAWRARAEPRVTPW